MNGNTRSVMVRLTPRQAVYALAVLDKADQVIEGPLAPVYRAAANVREALWAAGWTENYKTNEWLGPDQKESKS